MAEGPTHPRPLTVDLEGVPETLLWTLYHRAAEAARPDAVLRDPMALGVMSAIRFPFQERFGAAHDGWAQWQALRALTFDREITRYLAGAPDATVVALGEGLETQFWRVDNGRLRWVSIDLPEAVEVRERVLPPAPRLRMVAMSAVDTSWLDAIDRDAGVFVTAQGLFMYLERTQVRELIATCAARIADGVLMFDAVGRAVSERSSAGKFERGTGYVPPRWSWGIDDEDRAFIAGLPNVAALERVRLPRGRGAAFRYAAPVVQRIPRLGTALFSLHRVRFGERR
jgi:O-methyltransferase involved in polyketide biosynthesis